MRLLKTLLVFVTGIIAGGLIFGFSGPATSQASGYAPTDLFFLSSNISGTSKFKQYYRIKPEYKSKYKVLDAGKAGGDDGMYVYIGEK
jgi:hypothetical protein